MEGISRSNKQASLKKNVFITAVLVGVFVLGAMFVVSEPDRTDVDATNAEYQIWAPLNYSNVSSLSDFAFNFSIWMNNLSTTGHANTSFRNATLYVNFTDGSVMAANITNTTSGLNNIASGVINNATSLGNFTYLNITSTPRNGSAVPSSNGQYWWYIVTYNGSVSGSTTPIRTGGRWLFYDTIVPGIGAVSINTTSETKINMSEIEFFTINTTVTDATAGVMNVSFKMQNSTGNFTIGPMQTAPFKSDGPYGGNTTLNYTKLYGVGYHTSSWNWSSNLTYANNFTEGNYILWITAVDGALNNITNTSIHISIDKTAPTITPKEPISSTDNDIYRSNTPKLKIKVVDVGPSDVKNKDTGNVGCKYSIDNASTSDGTWNYDTNSDDNHKIYSFDTFVGNNEYESAPINEVSDGNHTAWAICQDKVGHNTTSRWFFMVRHSGGGSAGAGPRPAPEPDVDLATEAVSTQKVSEGSSRTFALPSGTVHTITVKSTTEDSATFVIASEPKEITVKVGESAEVDVDDDGSKDIKITLNSVAGDVADFNLEKLQQAPPATGGEPEPAQGIPMWVWIAVVVVILMIAGGVFMSKKK